MFAAASMSHERGSLFSVVRSSNCGEAITTYLLGTDGCIAHRSMSTYELAEKQLMSGGAVLRWWASAVMKKEGGSGADLVGSKLHSVL